MPVLRVLKPFSRAITVHMFDVTETIKYGPKIQTLVLHRVGQQVALYDNVIVIYNNNSNMSSKNQI